MVHILQSIFFQRHCVLVLWVWLYFFQQIKQRKAGREMWQSHLIHTGCHMSLLSFVGSLIIHDLTWKVLYLSIPSTFAFIINTMHSFGEKSSACQTLCHATVQVYKLHWYSMSFDRVTSLGLTVAFKWLHIKTKMTPSQVLEALVSKDFRGPKSYSLLDCAVNGVPVSVSLLWACFWQCPGLLSYLLKDPSSDYCFPRMYYVTSNWDSTLEFPFPIQSLPRKISWVIQILTFASNYRKHILHFKKTLRLNHYLTRGKLTWLIHIKMLPW